MQSNFIIDSTVQDVFSVCTSQPTEEACCGCRFVVYSPDHSLRGYWWIRKTDNGYTMTVKDPICRNHFMKTADTPEALVSHFYVSYVKYLKQIFDFLDRELKNLPERETVKTGFRPGWLKRKREQLINRRAVLRSRSRDALAALTSTTRTRGWPTVNLPQLPWENVNAATAAATAWVRDQHGLQVSEQPQHPYHRYDVRSNLKLCT